MYFSDEIYLVKEAWTQDELKQYKYTPIEVEVMSDLTSVSSTETAEAGKNGHRAEARAIIHIEDYEGQDIVRCPDGIPLIRPGYYEIYRKYKNGDLLELYLKEKVR